MVGSATIIGAQHYVAGIGHPKTDTSGEAAPAMLYENETGDVILAEIDGLKYPATPLSAARLATDGNSITAVSGGPVTTSLAPTTDAGWVTWAMGYSQLKFRWVENQAWPQTRCFPLQLRSCSALPLGLSRWTFHARGWSTLGKP